MIQTKLKFFRWFTHRNANHCHKFTKLKFEDAKYKHGLPYWILIRLFFWQPEVDKQPKFKSHKRMQVEFISNNVDVMTHDCLSSTCGPSIVWSDMFPRAKQRRHSAGQQATNLMSLVFPDRVTTAMLSCHRISRQSDYCDAKLQSYSLK